MAYTTAQANSIITAANKALATPVKTVSAPKISSGGSSVSNDFTKAYAGLTPTQQTAYAKANPNVNLATGGPNSTSNLVVNTPITPEALRPVTPIQLPNVTLTPAIDATSPSGVMAGITAGAGLNQQATPEQQQIDSTKQMTDLYKSIVGEAPKAEDIYNQTYNDSGLLQAQQEKNNLTAQINTITAQTNADIMSARNQSSTEGGTAGILSAREDAVNRSAAIKTLPLAAQLAVAQDNVALAQQHLDTLFQIRSQDATNQFNYKVKLYDSIKGDLDKKEQRIWDIGVLKLQQDMATGKELRTAQNTYLQNAVLSKAPASVINAINTATTMPDLIAAAGNYGMSQADKLDVQLKQAQIGSANRANQTVNTGTGSANAGSIDNDVKAILEGRNTAYNIRQTMGRTNAAAAYMQSLRDKITAIDPQFDFVASDAGGKSVSTSYVQRATASINAVLPNIDHIIQLSNDVNRVGVKGVDAQLQKVQQQFGNTKVSSFHEAQKLIADEIGVALGAGTVSDMKLQLGFDVTDPSVSQEVFASNMGIVKKFIENRKAGLDSLRYSSQTVNNSLNNGVIGNIILQGKTSTGMGYKVIN